MTYLKSEHSGWESVEYGWKIEFNWLVVPKVSFHPLRIIEKIKLEVKEKTKYLVIIFTNEIF